MKVHLRIMLIICLLASQVSTVVVVVQSLSRVWLFATPWTAALQASPSFSISRSLLKLMSIETVMPSNHLILCRSLLLLPSIFPSIRVFSNNQLFASGGQSIGASASASVLPVNIQTDFLRDWLVWSPCSPRDFQESSPTPQFETIKDLGVWSDFVIVSGTCIHKPMATAN